MRLTDFYIKLNEIYGHLEMVAFSEKNRQYRETLFVIDNAQDLITAFSLMEDIPILNKYPKRFKAISVNYPNMLSEQINLSQNMYNKTMSLFVEVRDVVATLKEVLADTIPEQKDNTLSIKLPPNLTSFKQCSDFFKQIDSIFNTLNYIDAEELTTVDGFDTGSEWIVISSAASVIIFLLTVIYKGLQIQNMYLQNQKVQLELKKLKEENISDEQIQGCKRMAEGLCSEYEQIKSEIITSTMKASQIKIKKVDENEFIEKMKKSFEVLMGLLISGMEVHPSLKAAPEIIAIGGRISDYIEHQRKMYIAVDKDKYLTVENPEFKSKDVDADTFEKSENDNDK